MKKENKIFTLIKNVITCFLEAGVDREEVLDRIFEPEKYPIYMGRTRHNLVVTGGDDRGRTRSIELTYGSILLLRETPEGGDITVLRGKKNPDVSLRLSPDSWYKLSKTLRIIKFNGRLL